MKAQLATGVEVVAVLLLGLMAGFFFAFAADVAPAMTHLDANGYITTQQWINRVVRNALFGGVFFGSVLLPFVAAGVLAWAGRRRSAWVWAVIGAAYFTAVFWVTRSVNVPINDALAQWNAAAPPATWQQARDTWNESNLVRTVASVVCFVAALLVLALGGRGARG